MTILIDIKETFDKSQDTSMKVEGKTPSNLEIEEKLQVEKEHLQKFTANNTHNG